MQELVIGLHIHTVYSDGFSTHAKIAQAALKAGLDALIITDHNVWVQDIEGYVQKGRKKCLLLVGEEVHDHTLSKGKNHLLIFGHNRELSPFAKDPQNLIDQAHRAGGITFLAHPIEDTLETFGERNFPWEDWAVTGFTGIELWNQMSEFKTRSASIPKAVWHALFPKYMSKGPLKRTLVLWDHLLTTRGKPVVAIAGVDAHAFPKHLGPLSAILYPYEFQFRALSTHIFTPKPLSGSLPEDKKMVIDALKAGHAFAGYDLPASTRDFRFTVNTKDGQFLMGDTVSAQGGMTIQVRLPLKTHCRLIKDGKIIKEFSDRQVLTHITKEPGIYRAEVYLNYLGKERGWIFSNPIYAFD